MMVEKGSKSLWFTAHVCKFCTDSTSALQGFCKSFITVLHRLDARGLEKFKFRGPFRTNSIGAQIFTDNFPRVPYIAVNIL